jgi:hypothetical protein
MERSSVHLLRSLARSNGGRKRDERRKAAYPEARE